MKCAEFERENSAGCYLAGELSEPEREAFELHYFECDSCFQELQDMRMAREAVRSAGAPATPVARRLRWWLAPGIGIAAALILGVFLYLKAKPEQAATDQAPSMSAPAAMKAAAVELARLEPPPYIATTLRGVQSNAGSEFRDAMRSYADHNYPAAGKALQKVLDRHPDSLDARYFLAISKLLSNDAAGSIAGLRMVIEAGGRSPYAEESHYYLAHALLRTGNKAGAKAELKKVAGMHGDYEQKARDVLKSIQ